MCVARTFSDPLDQVTTSRASLPFAFVNSSCHTANPASVAPQFDENPNRGLDQGEIQEGLRRGDGMDDVPQHSLPGVKNGDSRAEALQSLKKRAMVVVATGHRRN